MAHSDALIFLTNITWIFFLFLFTYFFFVCLVLPTFYKKFRARVLIKRLNVLTSLISIRNLFAIGSAFGDIARNTLLFFSLASSALETPLNDISSVSVLNNGWKRPVVRRLRVLATLVTGRVERMLVFSPTLFEVTELDGTFFYELNAPHMSEEAKLSAQFEALRPTLERALAKNIKH